MKITQPSISGFNGSNQSVRAYGIRVLPSGSLPANCSSGLPKYLTSYLHIGSSTTSCQPTAGGFLVVATGTLLFDYDTDEWVDGVPDDPGSPNEDELADICTLNASNESTSCALLLDNAGNIVARYPVTTTNGLRSLALDPLVTDCTTNSNCSPSYTPAPQVGNFWMGDSGSANFYEVNFASGTTLSFSANAGSCATAPCAPGLVGNIQGIGIYGGEGANQPGLAKLFQSPISLRSPTAQQAWRFWKT